MINLIKFIFNTIIATCVATVLYSDKKLEGIWTFALILMVIAFGTSAIAHLIAFFTERKLNSNKKNE